MTVTEAAMKPRASKAPRWLILILAVAGIAGLMLAGACSQSEYKPDEQKVVVTLTEEATTEKTTVDLSPTTDPKAVVVTVVVNGSEDQTGQASLRPVSGTTSSSYMGLYGDDFEKRYNDEGEPQGTIAVLGSNQLPGGTYELMVNGKSTNYFINAHVEAQE